MKVTKQRTLILDILQKAKKPLSASEILSRAIKVQPNLALTTIYRNLDALYGNDVIDRYRTHDKEYCFQIKKDKHTHYIVCKSCKKRIDLPECPIEEIENSIANSTGFTITSHNLELQGYCDNCKKK